MWNNGHGGRFRVGYTKCFHVLLRLSGRKQEAVAYEDRQTEGLFSEEVQSYLTEESGR